MEEITPGKGRLVAGDGNAEIAILSIGPAGNDAVKACEQLRGNGIAVDVYDMIWLKPLDTALIDSLSPAHRHIITVEDGAISGGLGAAVRRYADEHRLSMDVEMLGVGDKWVHHASVAQLKRMCGYDVQGIVDAAERVNVLKK